MIHSCTKLLVLGIFLMIISCGKPQKEGYYFQDFENISQWFAEGATPQITNEIARSGEFCTKMDSLNPYSQSFAKKMSEIKAKGYKKVKVKVWGAISNTSARCKLVVSVNINDQVLFWNGIPFNQFVSKPNTWGLITTEVDLEKYPGDGHFKAYAIIDGKEKAYMDDVEIQFSK